MLSTASSGGDEGSGSPGNTLEGYGIFTCMFYMHLSVETRGIQNMKEICLSASFSCVPDVPSLAFTQMLST